MLNWVLIICVLITGGYFLLVFFGLGAMGGGYRVVPYMIVVLLVMIGLLYPLSLDLHENYKLTHSEKQYIDYSKLKSGQLLLIEGRQYEFVKATNNKIVVIRNGELKVFRIKLTEVELVSE